ncbi:hypothetical protein INS49_014324 [Diaporthe citri]|uniref:uncharacterized protein n=1 Tax=Diaporthe citri TaxID=83186 RepID=UPI001C818E1B|nr:uncharacterized protein INS49_014324 [Diaporthe citri]KAG6358440.1 hypothetical protein INS49_014324 [Diaporthe citri]
MKPASLPRTFGLLVTFAANMNLAAAQVACAITQRPSSSPQAFNRGESTIDTNGTTNYAEVYYQSEPYAGYVDWEFTTTSENGPLDMKVFSTMADRIIACYKPPQSETCVWLDPKSGCSTEAPITGDMPSTIDEFSVYLA